jgi:hypothetical protein
MINKPDPNCECQGTGLLLTEGVVFGRARYNKELGHFETPMYGDGVWVQTQCYCLTD